MRAERRPPHRGAAGLLPAVLLVIGVAPAAAQRAAPEFTRQGLLVTAFAVAADTERELGSRVADEVRDRLEDQLPEREVEVMDDGEIRATLERAGFDPGAALNEGTLEQLGRSLRVDEILEGVVTRDANGLRVAAQLVLMRDRRMRQPLAPVSGRTVDQAAEALARAVATARVQLAHQRRCENFLRDGKGAQAVLAAREGVAAYARSALARTCLVTALRHTGASATEVLAVARDILAVDSVSPRALEAAGIALDSLRRRDEAAAVWTRLAATDTANLELTERVIWALHENGNSAAAEPLVVGAAAAHPDVLRLTQLQWRVANATRNWPLVVTTGETLLARDSIAARDSGFVIRLSGAYEATGRPYHALAAAARGVAVIPESSRLFALYARLVRGEADSVLPRGLALHPRSAELLAMSAEVLRAEGRLAEALSATRQAVAIDPLLPQGELTIAQAEFDLGRPDSALAALHRLVDRTRDPEDSLAADESEIPATDPPIATADSAVPRPPGVADAAPPAPFVAFTDATRDSVLARVAGFALAKGNVLLRAADATKNGDGFRLAAGFLSLADSLAPAPASTFLLGTATLGLANAAMTAGAAAEGAERCDLLRAADRHVVVARPALEAGRAVAAEAVTQYLAYLGQIEIFVRAQLATGCGEPQ